jgi:rod shape-determining protein MreC
LIRFKALIWLLIVVALSILSITTLKTHGEGLRKHSLKILRVPCAAINAGTRYVGNIVTETFLRQAILKENRSLRSQNEFLKSEIVRLREVAAENERLRSVLNFRNKYSSKIIIAAVIGRDILNWKDVIIINKGLKDGIRPNMPVMTNGMLVGKVTEAGNSASRVNLITDPASRASAIIQRNRAEGIIEGLSGGMCKMKYISISADVKVGDVIVTSGWGGIYPKGLVVGSVNSAGRDQTGLLQYAIVKPYADFSRLEEVACIESASAPF